MCAFNICCCRQLKKLWEPKLELQVAACDTDDAEDAPGQHLLLMGSLHGKQKNSYRKDE
jgi:hypothetical protein